MFFHFVFQSVLNSFKFYLSTFVLVYFVVFSHRVYILRPPLLDHLIFIRKSLNVILLYCIITTMSGSLYSCCSIILLFTSYRWVILFFSVHIFFFLVFFQGLLFCLHLLWLSAMFHMHTEEPV